MVYAFDNGYTFGGILSFVFYLNWHPFAIEHMFSTVLCNRIRACCYVIELAPFAIEAYGLDSSISVGDGCYFLLIAKCQCLGWRSVLEEICC